MIFNNYNWGDQTNWNAPQWTSNGFDYVSPDYANPENNLVANTPITHYYPYDFRNFFGMIENGAWNYTKHWPEDYVPHKL